MTTVPYVSHHCVFCAFGFGQDKKRFWVYFYWEGGMGMVLGFFFFVLVALGFFVGRGVVGVDFGFALLLHPFWEGVSFLLGDLWGFSL
jgi:hypothetical protein